MAPINKPMYTYEVYIGWIFWYVIIMENRKQPLVAGQYYHIFSRSIAQFIVFNNDNDYTRMLNGLMLYRFLNFNYKYSRFRELDKNKQDDILNGLENKSPVLIKIVAYCIMPTHIHLILKQSTDSGISQYMSKILNSYSRYFNTKHQRVGPLWAGRFKSVLVDNDEQILHLTRYIHLNPASAGLVENPEDWKFSSYLEYINRDNKTKRICEFGDILDFTPENYKKFVEDRKSYQQQLSLIKNILIDDYSG